jgi:hypothetical protein
MDRFTLLSEPNEDELMRLCSAGARVSFARKGFPDAIPTKINVAHVFELLVAPTPPLNDARPLQRWEVYVDFVCHDVKYADSLTGVFEWPEEPTGVPLEAMTAVLIVDSLSSRGDGPGYLNYTDLRSRKVTSTRETVTQPWELVATPIPHH